MHLIPHPLFDITEASAGTEAHRKGSQLPGELEQDLTSSLWADATWAYGAGLDLSGVH